MMARRRPGPLLLALGLLICLVLNLGPGAAPARAGSVDWQEVPASADGRQWWDAGSLRRSRAGYLSVLSRFQPAGGGDGTPAASDLYVMDIDCSQQLYRDTSVNGLPRFGAEWQAPAGEGLIAAVIDASCAAGAPLLQAS